MKSYKLLAVSMSVLMFSFCSQKEKAKVFSATEEELAPTTNKQVSKRACCSSKIPPRYFMSKKVEEK